MGPWRADDLAESTKGRPPSTIGAHELVHRITGIGDLKFDQSSPNDLMSYDHNPNKGAALASNTLELTDSEKQQLLNKCQQKHGG